MDPNATLQQVWRETVWCEAHDGLANPHVEQSDCLHPHFTGDYAMSVPTFGKQRFPIIAALPMFAGREMPDHYIMVCQSREASHVSGPEYVVATADSLSADTWMQGDYVRDLATALSRMYKRSEIAALTHLL